MSGRNDNANEMEQIQKGLEAFLEQELSQERNESNRIEEYKPEEIEENGPNRAEERNESKEITEMGENRTKKSSGQRSHVQRSREPQLYTLEDWDSPERPTRSKTASGNRTAGKQAGRTAQGQNQRYTSPGKSAAPKRKPPEREKVPDKRQKKRKNDKRKRKSRFRRFLIAVVLIVALLGVGLYSLVGVVYNKLNYEEVASVSALPMQEDGVVNVLLIGNDSRENGEDGRSDAMILLSLSSKTKTIYMTSLLRDMYVEIPGHDNNRLNAAYSFGGAELLMQTVEKNFDIPVNRYVQVNFEAFANLVDAVGGVELDLSSEEVEYVNGYLVEYNMLLDRPQGTDNLDPSVSGLIHLNGPQALAYCRNRYLGTDFGRTERQRKVLEAVIKKLPSALITNGSELFNSLMPNLTTNLTKNECFRLSLMASKLLTYDIIPTSIPQPGTYQNATIRKMAVLEVDFEANRKYLKENIYGE